MPAEPKFPCLPSIFSDRFRPPLIGTPQNAVYSPVLRMHSTDGSLDARQRRLYFETGGNGNATPTCRSRTRKVIEERKRKRSSEGS